MYEKSLASGFQGTGVSKHMYAKENIQMKNGKNPPT